MTAQNVADFLAAALQQQTEERRDFLICSPDETPDYYVQLPHPGEHPGVLYAEAVSDSYLTPELAIDTEAASALSGLGWNAPTTDPSTSTTGWDESRQAWVSANWFREFRLDDDDAYLTIAETMLETLRSAYGYTDGRLRVELGPSDRSAGLVGIFDPTSTTADEWSVAEEASFPVAPARRFSTKEVDQPAPSSYEWFPSLADVPGVDWTTPPGGAETLDARLTSARPVPDPESYSRSGIAWVDADGTVLADDFSRDQSPAELMLEGRYEQARDAEVVTRTVATALALPGTRHDYHTALEWLAGTEGIDPGWIERALLADVQLIAGNALAALNSPRWGDREGSLAAAGYPSWRLTALYLSEGFLADALRIEVMLDTLPEDARSDYRVGRASRVHKELEALRT